MLCIYTPCKCDFLDQTVCTRNIPCMSNDARSKQVKSHSSPTITLRHPPGSVRGKFAYYISIPYYCTSRLPCRVAKWSYRRPLESISTKCYLLATEMKSPGACA